MPTFPLRGNTGVTEETIEAITESRQYLRVRPSAEGTTTAPPVGIIKQLYASLQSTRSQSLTGIRADPGTLELLITSADGHDAPLQCLFRLEDPDRLEELASILRRLYPDGYRIEREEATLAAVLDLTPLAPADTSRQHTPDADSNPRNLPVPATDDVELPPVAGLELAAREQYANAWMYPLPTAGHADDGEPTTGPLGGVLERLATTRAPTALQILARPKPDWTVDQRLQTERIETESESAITSAISSALGGYEDDDLTDAQRRRIDAINDKQADTSFTINVRGVAFETDDSVAAAPTLASLADQFGTLESEYLKLTANQYGPATEGTAVTVLDRLLSGTVRTTASRFARVQSWAIGPATRPYLVADPEELWGLLRVDSESFPEATARATRTLTDDRPDVTLPDPDKLAHFDRGMVLGTALDGDGRPQQPIHLPPGLQQLHTMILGESGAGKSMLATRAIVENVAATDGPTILLDPKGDGLVESYKRAHYQQFGTLDDVIHIDFSRGVPDLSFFDIRDALAAGIPREHAVETQIDHFEDVLRALAGDSYDEAVRSPDVIRLLAKTCFDTAYGSDAFALDDLYTVGEHLQDGDLPAVSESLAHQLRTITEMPPDTRAKIMGGVFSRLDEVGLDDRLEHLFDHVSARHSAGFDLDSLLEDDIVVLLDMGDLQPQPRKAFSLVVLSELWFALKRRPTGASDDEDDVTDEPPLVNLYLEEAPSLANSDLLSELVAESRGFGLAITLLAQYPKQFQERADTQGDAALYGELVNDVSTVLAGAVSDDPKLGRLLSRLDPDRKTAADRLRSLDRGQWIASLPAPFGNERPRPFVLESPPLPPGHPEGPAPLEGDALQRYRAAESALRDRVATEYLRPYPSQQAQDATATTTTAGATSGSPFSAASTTGTEPESSGLPGGGGTHSTPGSNTHADAPTDPSTDPDTSAIGAGSPDPTETGPTQGSPTGDGAVSPRDLEGGHVPRTDALPPGVRYDPEATAYSCRSCLTRETDSVTRYPATGAGLRRALLCCRDPDAIDRSAIRQIPIPNLQLTPEEVTASQYSLAQLRYLKAIYTAVTDGYDSFTEFDIVEDSMRTLREDLGVTAAAVEDLEADNLISRDSYPHTVVGLRPAGRKLLREPWHHNNEFGHGLGDLDESGQHRLMIEAARRYLAHHYEGVRYDHEVVTYFERPTGERLDLAVIDGDDTLSIALEAERQNNDPIESTVATYTKLAALDLEEAIWLVPTEEEAHEILDILAEESATPDSPVDYNGPTYSETTRVTHFELDDPGITDMYTIRQLKSTVEPPWEQSHS